MIEMCDIITPYKCSKCGQEMLFFITNSGLLLDYKKLFYSGLSAQEIKNFVANNKVKYIKCIGCNNTFIIDWRKKYPMQLLDKNLLKEFGI